MHGQAADQKIPPFRGLRDGIAFGVDLQQFTFCHERVEAVGQFTARLALDAQFAQELLVARRLLRLAGDVAENG